MNTINVRDLRKKHAELQSLLNKRNASPTERLDADLSTKREELRVTNIDFSLHVRAGNAAGASAAKAAALALEDEIGDLTRLKEASKSGVEDPAAAAETKAILDRGSELYRETSRIGIQLKSNHEDAVRKALEARQSYLDAVGEIGRIGRTLCETARLLSNTGRWRGGEERLNPTSLRPEPLYGIATQVAGTTRKCLKDRLMLPEDEIMSSFGTESTWSNL